MIPREIDELMWTIAEGNEPGAVEEFGDRYPNLREELLKRIRTIKALKSGSRMSKSSQVPTFQNTKVKPTNWNLIWATFGFAIVTIIAFGIFKLNSAQTPSSNVAPVNLEPSKLPDANLQATPPRRFQPKAVPNMANANPAPQDPGQPSGGTNWNTQIPSAGKTLQLEAAPLHTAIELIAEAGHFTVTIANGMPNPTVKINFENMDPMAMLKELGEQYAFSPVQDGDHAVLIIPKKDEDEGQIKDNR